MDDTNDELFLIICIVVAVMFYCIVFCFLTESCEKQSIPEETEASAEVVDYENKMLLSPINYNWSKRTFVQKDTEQEEHDWLTFISTAYTNAEGENGKWGAVDCRKGEPLVDGLHIASDLSYLPYGTKVYIEGIGERIVVDTCEHLDYVNQLASDHNCDGWIDIYMGNRNEDMDAWGVREVRLYIMED